MRDRIEDSGYGIKDTGCDARRSNELDYALISHSVFRVLNSESRILNPPKGFTLVELLIVVSIVGILASMLFTRVLFYREMAEKAAMQQVVGALQSALVLQYGHRMALGMGTEVNNITTENPLEWLAQKPGNYSGENNEIKPGSVAPGNWAFDLSTHELVYIPDHNEHFEPAKDGQKWIRFRTRFSYEAIPGNKGKRAKVLTGVTFAPVEPYHWLIREN